ncbi:TROVE domain-containing protein [Chitinophaga sancti]|uniref:TROVE domain-containing protein n=1 Tax=Chitinophaga sancti TaxID=1004 RepID=A0A1K1QE36_9BACT|nr:TROVE domain-containing protein [Chitinophaga sancti]WQD61403.1 TROVE domain-containing protein [Chitinophaga sancti]WQG93044.1 TROVE domain-containing protein [Chitinophaga sancti]SFW57891.1 TROVE domain-containing protein [Chitinophaga sancti]
MRFNTSKKDVSATVNYEGAKAYTLTPELELYSAVVTASLHDQFYEGSAERLVRIRELIKKNDPQFVARLAVYTREKMYLRSIPLVLAVELAKIHTGNGLVSNMVNRVVQRADEITELLAFYALSNHRNQTKKLNRLSKQIQKGLSLAFNKFDEYQFAKYNRAAAVTLKDALFIVHPKPKDDDQQILFDKIAQDELQVPYTWETTLTATGQVKYSDAGERQKAFRYAWEQLVESNTLGYMALIRNLRNILQAEVDKRIIDKVCAQLADEKAVLQSKQLPFRFLSAYRELKQVKHKRTKDVLEALETAIQISVQHLQGFDSDTRVVIACDVSGSMQKAVSARSVVKYYDIGLLLGMLLKHKCENVVTGMFGDKWKVVKFPKKNILENVDAFYQREGEVGYSTNGHLVLADLIRSGQVTDKVMMFTDCQMWNSNAGHQRDKSAMEDLWKRYRSMVPHAKLYLFDLAGNGTTPVDVRGDGVYLIAGWSDKVFEILAAMEKGEDAVEHIKALTF